MSPQATIDALRTGLALVEALAPVVGQLEGGVASAARIAEELATIGQAALNAASGLSTNDLAALSDLTIALQAKNDTLAAAVAAS